MSVHPSNLFLSSLSPESRDGLLALCTAVSLPIKTSLYDADRIPSYAYFMTSGMASVIASTQSGATVEVGVIGHEGMVGSVHILGPAPVSRNLLFS